MAHESDHRNQAVACDSLNTSRWHDPLRVWLATAAVSLLILTPSLGVNRVLTYHETCFAQPAREMLATGEFLMPKIAGVAFPDKPPLMHWLTMLAIWLGGENAAVVRMPAVLAGTLLALLVAEFARRAFNARIAFLAGAIQSTMFHTVMQARLAECDILLTLAVAVSLGTFGAVEFGLAPRTSFARLLAAVAAVAAFLAKGPIGLVFVFGGAFTFLAVRRESGSWRFWLHPPTLLLLLAGLLCWPTLAFINNPDVLDGWRRHNFDRFSGAMGESTSSIYYLWMTPLLLLPWTPWAVAGWRYSSSGEKDFHYARSRISPAELRAFTLCWLLPGLLFLSTASWKHKHYVLPLLPPFAVWAAVGLYAWSKARPCLTPRNTAIVFSAAAASVVVVVNCFVQMPGITVVCLIAVITSPLVNYWRVNHRPFRAAGTLIGGVAAVVCYTLVFILPNHDSYRDQVLFADRIRTQIGEEPLYVPYIPTGPGVPAALPENQITYYLPLSMKVVYDRRPPPPDCWLLAPLKFQAQFRSWGSIRVVDQCDSIRGLMKDDDRLTLFRLEAPTRVFAQ